MSSKQRNTNLGRGTWALLGLLGGGLCIWASTGWQSLNARAAVAGTSAAQVQASMRLADEPSPWREPESAELTGNPEIRLLSAYRLVGQGRLREALAATRSLVQAYPQFRLGQLLYADLLAAQAQPLQGFGAIEAVETGASSPRTAADALAGLRAEARARLAALADQPPAGTLPAEFISLPASVPFALAVDTSHSRLFLFEQTSSGWRMAEDFYVSVGKRGVGKQTEGDQRTPLGVYYTQGHVSAKRLDERFGAGALPLNYPNAFDRQLGRTGSGILLHGVPNNTYSRPPLDSDGCVAMANEDLQRLAAKLPEQGTPVLITKSIHWVAPQQKPAAPADFAAAWQRWQTARSQGVIQDMATLYAPAAKPAESEAEDASAIFRRRLEEAPASIEEVSMLTWQDEQAAMVVSFRERSIAKGKRREQGVRQYWAKQPEGWRIVAEGPTR